MASLVVRRPQVSGYLCMQTTIKGRTNKKVAILPFSVSHAKQRRSISATMFPEAEEGEDPRVSGF